MVIDNIYLRDNLAFAVTPFTLAQRCVTRICENPTRLISRNLTVAKCLQTVQPNNLHAPLLRVHGIEGAVVVTIDRTLMFPLRLIMTRTMMADGFH